MNDLISIIIPVYNVEKYVCRCIDSLLNQSYGNIEIILVDDGSTDRSGKICEQYKNKDSRIRVVHQENRGLGAARNLGIRLSEGKYLAFVDSDDWIEPETYEYLYNSIINYDCSIACCGRKNVSDLRTEHTYFLLNRPIILKGKQILKSYLLQKNFDMSVCDKLFKKSLFNDVKFPENKLNSEDTVPCYQIMKKAKKVICTGKPFYNYYIRSGSLSRSKFHKNYMGVIYYSETVFNDVCVNYPYLEKEAQSFYFDRLISVWRLIIRCRYEGDEYFAVKNKIITNSRKIISNPYLPCRIKVFTLFILLKMDRQYDFFYVSCKKLIQKFQNFTGKMDY